MSDHLPIVEVPESTWLRALAHALDPGAEVPDESLVPDDDPVAASSDELDIGDDDADDEGADDADDDASAALDDTDVNVWDTDDTWSPGHEDADTGTHDDLHHDDGIG